MGLQCVRSTFPAWDRTMAVEASRRSPSVYLLPRDGRTAAAEHGTGLIFHYPESFTPCRPTQRLDVVTQWTTRLTLGNIRRSLCQGFPMDTKFHGYSHRQLPHIGIALKRQVSTLTLKKLICIYTHAILRCLTHVGLVETLQKNYFLSASSLMFIVV